MADLTVDGSLALGGAACVMLIRGGVNPWLALLIAALCGAAEDDVVTPALEAAVLRAEGYASGWVYVNKVETPQDWRNAEALAALLPGKVVAGSLWEKRYRTIS